MKFKKYFYITFILMFAKTFAHTAEDILQSLSLEQKIAQLFVVSVDNSEYLPADTDLKNPSLYFCNERAERFNKVYAEKMITDYEVGGILFIGNGTLSSSMEAIRKLQKLSKLPLLVTQDFEFGLNMRLIDAIKFPYNMTLGAIQNNELIYKMGKEISRQCKLLGVHINFSPVADVNVNPKNPIINFRSFGEDKNNVAEKAICMMQGLQDGGIIACAKHFCGHGDTDVDSHLDLPIIRHSMQRLESVEIYPFKRLIDAGIKSIMTAHIHVPAIDDRENRSVTLSKSAITDLLQHKLNFSKLIVTDALSMDAISKYFKPGEVELEAFLAGNDILLMSEHIPAGIAAIKNAIENDQIDEQELDRRALKILKAKEELGLLDSKISDVLPEVEDFNTQEANQLNRELFEAAVTLVRNDDNMIPLKKYDGSIAVVEISAYKDSVFYEKLSENQDVKFDRFSISRKAGSIEWQNLINNLDQYDNLIVTISKINRLREPNNGLTEATIKFIESMQELNKKLMVIFFGSPYCLKHFKNLHTIVMAYEVEVEAQLAAVKVIYGQINPIGRLPIDYQL